MKNGGEGGIRTLGSLLDYGALAKRCFRPLSHLTNVGGRDYMIRVAGVKCGKRNVFALGGENWERIHANCYFRMPRRG